MTSIHVPDTYYITLPVVEVCALEPEIEALTRLIRAEAQDFDLDKLFIVQVVLNRKDSCETITDILSAPGQFTGCNSKQYWKPVRMSDYWLIKAFLIRDSSIHHYKHFLNPSIATDKFFIEYANRQPGRWVGKHFYF